MFWHILYLKQDTKNKLFCQSKKGFSKIVYNVFLAHFWEELRKYIISPILYGYLGEKGGGGRGIRFIGKIYFLFFLVVLSGQIKVGVTYEDPVLKPLRFKSDMHRTALMYEWDYCMDYQERFHIYPLMM